MIRIVGTLVPRLVIFAIDVASRVTLFATVLWVVAKEFRPKVGFAVLCYVNIELLVF